MKRCVAIAAVSVLLRAVTSQASAGPHWVDVVTEDTHTFPSKGVFDLFMEPSGPLIPGITLFGPTTVWNSDAYDTPDPLDPNHVNYIDTEMVSMTLTGGGITVIAGDGIGGGLNNDPPLPAPQLHSPGWIEEDPLDPTEADSFFDVNFMIILPPAMGGMTLVTDTLAPHAMHAKITEVPPQVFVYTNVGSTPLYEEGNPGGLVIATITTSKHTPEPSSVVLLAVGAVCLLGYVWRRRR